MGGVVNTVKKAFDNPVRGLANVMTFGTAELANKALGGGLFNNDAKFGLGPLGQLGATAGAAYLGGPLGGAAMGGLLGGPGGALGGGLGGMLMGGGGGGGGLGGGLGSALGGSMLGYGMSMDPRVGNVQMPDWNQNQGEIQAEQGRQQQMIDSLMGKTRGLYGEQNDLLGQRMQSERNNLMRQMTTGPEGEAFRQKYNNMGMLNSGAFETGLANQFGNLAAQQQQDMLNQQIQQTGGLGNILNEGYGVQSGLGQSGLQRQFGLQDANSQMSLARAIQDAQMQQQKQQALIGGGSYLLGQGMGGGGGGGMPQQPGGGGGIPNLVQSLMGGIGTLGKGIGGLFGFGGTQQPGTGNPNLDLYGGGTGLGRYANPVMQYRGSL